jgi:hypothetical protein
MLFIAALALGTFAIRTTFPDMRILWSKLIRDDPPGYWYLWAFQVSLSVVSVYLEFLTPAILIIRLRQPHPSLRRLGRQPGLIACVVVTVALALDSVRVASIWSRGSGILWVPTVLVDYAQHVGFALMGGWIALLLSGRWRSEPGWVDRLGRLLGINWIAVAVLSWSRYWLWP